MKKSIALLLFKIIITKKLIHANQTFWLGSRWVLGLGFRSGPKSKPKPQTQFFLGLTNSEFNSIHFDVEIKKKIFFECLKFLGLKKFEIS
jgi:hypothetical protein